MIKYDFPCIFEEPNSKGKSMIVISAKRICLFIFTLIAAHNVCFGQTTQKTPIPDNEAQKRADEMREKRRDEAEMQKKQLEYQRIVLANAQNTGRKAKPVARLRKYPNKKELALVAPNAELLRKHSAFLKNRGTGITRLISDKGCGANARILSVEEHCRKFGKIPGFGSSFSFRVKRYVLGRFADVVYRNGFLYAYGNRTIGFFVDLGSIEIDNVNEDVDGAKFVFEFAPGTTDSEASKQNAELIEGIKADGYEYKKIVPLTVGKTYLVRSVAYRVQTKIIKNGRPVFFQNTRFDRRRDTIVAFRVVDLNGEKDVTFIWKILRSIKSPKLKIREK